MKYLIEAHCDSTPTANSIMDFWRVDSEERGRETQADIADLVMDALNHPDCECVRIEREE